MSVFSSILRFVKSNKITHILIKLFIFSQAYDSVWRDALYAKLKRIGFGGKTLSLIKSMYHNDNIQFLINNHLTDSLYLTQGVKQGKKQVGKNIKNYL